MKEPRCPDTAHVWTSDASVRSNDAYAWGRHYQVNRGYTADGPNRYTQAASGGGTTNYSFDANGNLAGDGTNGWTYDRESRLVASSAGPVLTYDPLGRLYQVTSGSNTTRFLWDGWTLVAEYDGGGAVTERYVHGDGPSTGSGDNPIFWYHGSSVGSTNRRQFYADPLGSIVAITDAAGNRTNVNSYDEYGIPASGNTGRFQYTGQIWLPELGMQYSRNRIYSPTMGRFMQTDPIGVAGGINLYGYVTNDPVNLIDPSGLNPDCDDLSVQWDNKVGCPPEDPEENVVVTGTRGGSWGASSYYASGMGTGGGGGGESNSPVCVPAGTRFDTARQAGVAGARLAEHTRRAANDTFNEYGGRIISLPGGGFTFTQPVRGGDGTFLSRMPLMTPGWYHIHNPGFGSQLSHREDNRDAPRDRETVLRFVQGGNTNFVTILGATDTGRVYSWNGAQRLGNTGRDEGTIRCHMP